MLAPSVGFNSLKNIMYNQYILIKYYDLLEFFIKENHRFYSWISNITWFYTSRAKI